MAEFAEDDPRPVVTHEAFPRSAWKAPGAAKGPYAVAVDQGAKLHMNINEINGDPIVMILPESVPDNHLAELRRDGISYLFAGRNRSTWLSLSNASVPISASNGCCSKAAAASTAAFCRPGSSTRSASSSCLSPTAASTMPTVRSSDRAGNAFVAHVPRANS